MSRLRVLCISSHGDTLNSIRPEAEMFIGAKRAGVDVEMMVQLDSVYAEPVRDAGIVMHDYVIRRKFDRGAVAAIRRLIDERHIDILHMFNNKAIVNGIRAARGRAVKLVTYRGQTGNISRWDPTCYLTHLHPRIDKITCVSDSVRDDLRRQLFTPDKAVRIYKGHDLSWYRDEPADLLEFGLTADDFVVCSVANLRPRKGLGFLIESAKYLPPEAPIKYLLVGKGVDSDGVRDAVAAYPGRFILAGFRRDAPALAAACQTSVLAASKREGLPKTVIESMAYGTTPIATRTGGSPELIADGETGLIVEPGNAEAIASAILYLWRNPDKNREMGKRARKRIASHFNIRDTVTELVALYRQLVPAV